MSIVVRVVAVWGVCLFALLSRCVVLILYYMHQIVPHPFPIFIYKSMTESLPSLVILVVVGPVLRTKRFGLRTDRVGGTSVDMESIGTP